MKQVWETSDGEIFYDKQQATEHEHMVETQSIREVFGDDTDVVKYLRDYYGKDLMIDHDLDELGVWKIEGEDQNCDLSGPRKIPVLGYLEGKLKDVIKKAVHMRGFSAWGSGGQITKIEVERAKDG